MPVAKRPRQIQLFASEATWPHGAAEAWASVQAPTSLFAASNPRADWRATTVEGVRQAYLKWVRWSSNRKTFPAEADFAERVTPSELEGYVKHLRMDIADSSIATSLAFLKMALRTMAPTQDWSWMDPAISSVKRSAKPVRNKRGRLVPMHDLVALGYDLMEQSGCRSDEVPRHEQATEYRNGLKTALLAVRPSRLANFSGITIGQHLVERDGHYWFNFKGCETKNEEELDRHVPEFLERQLRFYLDHVRPVLAAGPRGNGNSASNHLWLTHLGSPLRRYGVYRAITAVTKARFGHSIHPHLFRDCLASTIANEDPDKVQLIKFALGHLSSATADKYYIHAERNRALTRVQQHVLSRRAARPLDKLSNPGNITVRQGVGSCFMHTPHGTARAVTSSSSP